MTAAEDSTGSDSDPHARMRATDADRELVHEILSAAMAQGSLSPAEYSERAGKALIAKTFGDLDSLTDDLPVTQLGVSLPAAQPDYRAPRVSPGGGREPISSRLAIMSGSELKGQSVVGDHLSATAIMGGVEIDLREVEFLSAHLTIQCLAIMGGIDITVPPGIGVEIGGTAVLGGFGGRAAGPGALGAPTVHVTGVALLGGVEVTRKDRGQQKQWWRYKN